MESAGVLIRAARPEDWPILATFNAQLAWETEQKRLDSDVLAAGIRALLSDPAKGRYFVAEVDSLVVGQLMHTREWSDWRNGDIWWLQSVYVEPEFRRRGVFRALFTQLRQEAEREPGVVGIRLYVEQANDRAHHTYRSLGMDVAGYFVMEQMLLTPGP